MEKGSHPETPADQPALEKQGETDGIAGYAHDAEGMDDACRYVGKEKRRQGVDPSQNEQ